MVFSTRKHISYPMVVLDSLSSVTVTWLNRLVTGFTAQDRVRARVISFGIYGEQRETGTGFSPSS
jgi:hypothetical protein